MLKIGIITPWAVRCGIATFSQHLVDALKEYADCYVVPISRFGQKDNQYFRYIVSQIPKVDLLLIQHEYGLYGMGLEKQFYPLLKIFDIPIVTEMHATGNMDIDPTVLNYSDKVIVHNEFCKSRLPAWDRVQIIPHPVPLQTLPIPRKEARQRLSIPQDAFVMSMFGFVTQYKGHDVILSMMKELPDNVYLIIAGGWHIKGEDTEYINKVKQVAGQFEDRVRFLGWVPEEGLSGVFDATDIVLSPHRIASESGSLMTALGHGKCVIASNVGPFVEKKDTIIVSNNEGDMKGWVKHLRSNPEDVEPWEERARKYAKANSYAEIVKEHIKLYESLI